MRILLVEDDEQLAEAVARGLRKQAHAVDIAPDGDEAIFLVETGSYDVVLLDVMLPGKDGLETCRELRASGSKVPILMLTARDGLADRVTGLDSGADDYLTKPFHLEELLARIRALGRRREIPRRTRLEVGDLVLDSAAHLVTRGSAVVALTAKEYAVLEFLMQNAGRACTATEIAENAWDMNYEGLSNSVAVYIRRLRVKIDAVHAVPLLYTRRGYGYVLTADPDPALDVPSRRDD
jgi:DNA-binding response OmpR family regulator